MTILSSKDLVCYWVCGKKGRINWCLVEKMEQKRPPMSQNTRIKKRKSMRRSISTNNLYQVPLMSNSETFGSDDKAMHSWLLKKGILTTGHGEG